MRAALIGPYELSFDTVDVLLRRAVGGLYALGHVDVEGVFRIQRVGRDDKDLRSCLHGFIGSSNQFKYAAAASPLLAFRGECTLFHRFRPPGNIIHPTRPIGTNWVCPVCFELHR